MQLADEAWARRVSGVFGNDLANQSPDRAHIVLTLNKVKNKVNEEQEDKGLGAITGASVLNLGGGKAFWTLLVVYIVTILGMAVYIFVSGKKKE